MGLIGCPILYHKLGVKNGFTFTLKFLLLIFASLGDVIGSKAYQGIRVRLKI